MANWFKVYETDLDDSKFQLLVDENPTVISVWFWILTECAKFKDGVIDFKFEPRYFRMIGKKINQDSACISDALNALHKDGFIILGENSIELIGWESRQSEFMRKQKGKEIKKVKESLNLSPDKDLTMSEVRPDNVPIRREEKEEKRREEKEKNKKEENILNTLHEEEKTILSSKLDPTFKKAEDCNTQAIQLLKSSKPTKPQDSPQKTEGSQVFEAYSVAYQERYNIPPVRNAKTNALCAQLVKRLGVEEAIQTVSFYITHNDAFYFRSGHSLDLLVRDAEKLRTECLTGAKTTMTSSQKVDKQQTKTAFWNEMLAKARAQDELKKQGAI